MTSDTARWSTLAALLVVLVMVGIALQREEGPNDVLWTDSEISEKLAHRGAEPRSSLWTALAGCDNKSSLSRYHLPQLPTGAKSEGSIDANVSIQCGLQAQSILCDLWPRVGSSCFSFLHERVRSRDVDPLQGLRSANGDGGQVDASAASDVLAAGCGIIERANYAPAMWLAPGSVTPKGETFRCNFSLAHLPFLAIPICPPASGTRCASHLLTAGSGRGQETQEAAAKSGTEKNKRDIIGNGGQTDDSWLVTPPSSPSEPAVLAAPEPAVKDIICSVFWPCEEALRVAWCESRFNPQAENGVSYGLMQLWQGHAAKWPDFWERWSDPAWNVQHAYELWVEQGWIPWICKP